MLRTALMFAVLLIPSQEAKSHKGKPFPTPAGDAWINLARPPRPDDLRGRAVLVVFLTPGAETGHLVSWAKDFGDSLIVIAVCRGGKNDTFDSVKPWVWKTGMTFPVLFDAGSTYSDSIGVRETPAAYLLDIGGIVAWEGVPTAGLEAEIKAQASRTLAGRLDSIMADLASDAADVRAGAQAELSQLTQPYPRAARPLLKRRIAASTDPEVVEALRRALEALPTLELEADPDGPAVVGRPLRLKVRIRNVGLKEVVAVQALDGSDSGARYPKVEVRISDSAGERLDRSLPERSPAGLRSIAPPDFGLLAPDKEIDVFGRFPHGVLKSWIPGKPGRYRITVAVDYRERNFGHWMGTSSMQDRLVQELEALLARVPALWLEMTIEIDVK